MEVRKRKEEKETKVEQRQLGVKIRVCGEKVKPDDE